LGKLFEKSFPKPFQKLLRKNNKKEKYWRKLFIIFESF